jgi:hypothetical protein
MSLSAAVMLRLARGALGQRGLLHDLPPRTLGDITLLPHQVAAVQWLRPRLARYGGALLADPPGFGKTYVALAIAAEQQTIPLVIAPAAVRSRWQTASRETGITIAFVSTEQLSAPKEVLIRAPTLVIIDEAHHLRTRSTRRHQRTALLCANATVLLLSATPIQNRTHDLEHITQLFHLPASRQSATYLRRRLMLRRTLAAVHAVTPSAPGARVMPRILVKRSPVLPLQHAALPAAILALPPIRADSAEGHVLLQLGLLHALRSSDAAARERVQRRIAATVAIEQSAAAGIEPTPALRKAFQCVDGAVQLAMPELFAAPSTTIDPRLTVGAGEQRRALESLLPHLTGDGDVSRSVVLRRLARWCERPVVAFTQFGATAARLFHLLRRETGIALLTGSGAQIATGTVSRAEVLQRLLSDRYAARHDAVRLLITTDVLSEGLSLAGVATIVHLDLPWTAARLDQRVGRAARIGAPAREVRVMMLPAPLPASAHAALQALLDRKRNRMSRVARDGAGGDRALSTLCTMSASGRGGGAVRAWVTMHSSAVHSPTTIAIVRVRRDRLLVAMDHRGLRAPDTDDWCALAQAIPAPQQRGGIARLRRALCAWLANTELSALVRDSRDDRLRSRQEADEQLVNTVRSARGALAGEISVQRQLAMTSGRRRGLSDVTEISDERFPPESRRRTETHLNPRSRGMTARQSDWHVSILCGVLLTPTEE